MSTEQVDLINHHEVRGPLTTESGCLCVTDIPRLVPRTDDHCICVLHTWCSLKVKSGLLRESEQSQCMQHYQVLPKYVLLYLCRLDKHRATRQFIGNLTCMYFCRGVACEYFGAYRTRSRVVHVVGFWGGPKFEANVHRLKTSATCPHDDLWEI